jgi:alpha-tubulin suppressor-like RCC1 family protein
MRRHNRRTARLLLSLVMFCSLLGLPAASGAGPGATPPSRDEEPVDPARKACEDAGLIFIPEAGVCTHGDDPAPEGADISRDVRPISRAAYKGAEGLRTQASLMEPRFECDGDGLTGYRTQVMYVRAADRPDRLAEFRESFQQWAFEADFIYRTSAQDTGGMRSIRFVHDAGCVPTIEAVTLSATGDDTYGNTLTELIALRHERPDRVYMMFVDANVYCGLGSRDTDNRHGQGNRNNTGAAYSRIDAGCWSGRTAAHEHMHNMGGVQREAPNASGGGHCVDRYEVMCYSDAPNYPAMRDACPASYALKFDCNHDDYFHTDPPPGSYLATHWNTANNRFLVGGGEGVPCDDPAEPDDYSSEAHRLTLGVARIHKFCWEGDRDWFVFDGVANQTYQLEIAPLEGEAQPVATILTSNARFEVGYVPWLTPVRDFTPKTGGDVFVKMSDNYNGGDQAQSYSVKVSARPNIPRAAFGWGYNALGQVGTDNYSWPPSEYQSTPFHSLNPIDVSAGAYHSLAVRADGTVLGVGWNGYGQLGNGAITGSGRPVVVRGLTGVASVSAGYLHSLAVKKDGTVWAWGGNNINQLGDGTTVDRRTPVKVAGLTEVVQVSAGWFHNLALKKDGSVWAWGWNGWGMLGNGGTQPAAVPFKVDVPPSFSVSAGLLHSLVAGRDGQARAWGWNAMGQLGDGTKIDRSRPVSVSAVPDVYMVSAGALHSTALLNNGKVLGWGDNTFGQAGGPTSDARVVPGPILCRVVDVKCAWINPPEEVLSEVKWISSGGYHNLAINVMQTAGGTIYSWGWNGADQTTPAMPAEGSAKAVWGATGSNQVSAGYLHSLMLQWAVPDPG